MADNSSTTKFKVDISQLKKEFQEAQRHIKLVTSEFKASTASMDRWSDNADGLSAKIKELNGILTAEEKKLDSLQKQYELTAKEQGENSKGAQELMIKLNNQRAAVEKVRSSISYYTDKLNDLTSESKQAASASDKLRSTIQDQESELASLKSKYASLVVEQKGSTEEAKQLAKRISELSSDLKSNKSALLEAESAADKFDKTLDDLDDSAKNASDGFTVMKGALADLLADGIKSVVDGIKDFAVESESANNKFQAATGASTEEMEDFTEQMDELYKNAYSDSLEDIGDKMAYVKQVTGEVDPSKIKELTENAMALEDTFGSDFNETIRGVNNLMTHFGISSEEAFDLFAKGSQEGLDYTGELGDNIAEYGGNFQQAGYSAEEYFQLLVNGSKNGAYNLDKVNDSINEVKNRLGDGTIEKNLDIFSDGTKQAFKNWEDGKGTMKDVIDSIVDDINECTDEQDALTMAQVAFGTMGEDANLKVVKSLKSTGSTFKDVGNTMKDLKKIRYDDIGTQFKELGRTLQTEMLKPLAEKAFPYFKKLADVAITNMDKIIPVATALGIAITAIFTINKAATLISSLGTLATALGITKVATDAQTASTLALNTAWLASPITWVIAAIGGLTAALVIANKKQQEAIEAEYGLSEAQKETVESAKSLNEEYNKMNDARNESMSSINTEFSYLDQLKNELNGLVDSNGKVKEGYEDRANFIVNELSSALGMEKDKIWEIIQSNGELGDSIDQLIQKKQAEATLAANEDAYTEAIQKRNDALQTYQDNLTVLEEAEKKYNEVKEEGNSVMEMYNYLLSVNPEQAAYYYMGNKKIIAANEEAKKSYEEAKEGVKQSEEAYVGYNTTIQNYEGLSSAIISGDAAKIEDALLNMQNGFISAENGTKESLERQVKNMEDNYESLKQAIENNTPGVTQEMVDQAAEMVDKAEEELDKLEPKASESGENAGKAYADGVGSKSGDGKKSGEKVSSETNKGLGSPNTYQTGNKKAGEYTSGIGSQQNYAGQTGTALSNSVNSGLGSANTYATGNQKIVQFNSGINSVGTYNSGKGRADDANSGLKSVDTYTTGDNFTAGFSNGLSSGASSTSIWTKAWNLGKKALDGLKQAIREGSPSKETYQSGDFFVAGFANAISDGTKIAVEKAKKMGRETLDALNAEMDTGIDVPQMNTIRSSMASTKKAVRRNTGNFSGNVGGQTVNNYNFYQTNNSPKSLSRLEIYRQTKNQLNFAKGVS